MLLMRKILAVNIMSSISLIELVRVTTIGGQEGAMMKHRCVCAAICQSVQRRVDRFWHKICVCACVQKVGGVARVANHTSMGK